MITPCATRRTRLLPLSETYSWPTALNLRSAGENSFAFSAGPPSPAKPAPPSPEPGPKPATVSITPSGVTRRMRLLARR